MYTEDFDEQEDVLERGSSGASVRHLATVLFVLGLAGAVVLGGFVITWTDEPLYGLFAGLAAGYLSWAFTRILRSFGEMAEDAAATRRAIARLLAIQEEQRAAGAAPAAAIEPDLADAKYKVGD